MKYLIGVQSFDPLIENGYVYADETNLVYQLVATGKIYFLSRPRRFGKSLLVSTLKFTFKAGKTCSMAWSSSGWKRSRRNIRRSA